MTKMQESLRKAIWEAKRQGRETGKEHYIFRDLSNPEVPYGVSSTPPFFGEWYTVDGIQHGSGE